jgi:hypothetical protein
VAALPGAGIEATISDKTTMKVAIIRLRMSQRIHGVAISTTQAFYFTASMSTTSPVTTHVPKNGVSRSKRFLKPLPPPQHNKWFTISHQPHEGGDGAKCGAKFADTPCVIYIEVTGVRSE